MKNLNKPITARLPVDAEVFPEDIVQAIHDHDEIMEFILAMDAEVEDYDFTKDLIARLQQSLDKEDEVPTKRGQFVRSSLSTIVWVVDVISDYDFIGMLYNGDTKSFVFNDILEILDIPATENVIEAIRILKVENGVENGTT